MSRPDAPKDPASPVARDPAVSGLSTRHPTPFALRPDAEDMGRIARELDLTGLRKLSFAGDIRPLGRRGWALNGKLGATVTQPCVVTLAPVTTRIDEEVSRQFLPAALIDRPEAGSETEMPEDDTIEPLGDTIPLGDLMVEALSLALPPYPRAEGVELGSAQVAPPGAAPIRDDDVKPFAALQALRDRLDDAPDKDD